MNSALVKQVANLVLFPKLKLYEGEPIHWEAVLDVMQSHHIIKSSRLPNFLKCRIPVYTNLNVKNWRYYLRSYWDQQLPDLLQYVFLLDFNRNCELQSVGLLTH